MTASVLQRCCLHSCTCRFTPFYTRRCTRHGEVASSGIRVYSARSGTIEGCVGLVCSFNLVTNQCHVQTTHQRCDCVPGPLRPVANHSTTLGLAHPACSLPSGGAGHRTGEMQRQCSAVFTTTAISNNSQPHQRFHIHSHCCRRRRRCRCCGCWRYCCWFHCWCWCHCRCFHRWW